MKKSFKKVGYICLMGKIYEVFSKADSLTESNCNNVILSRINYSMKRVYIHPKYYYNGNTIN